MRDSATSSRRHLVIPWEIAGSETYQIRIRHEGATNKVQAPAAATPRRSRFERPPRRMLLL